MGRIDAGVDDAHLDALTRDVERLASRLRAKVPVGRVHRGLHGEVLFHAEHAGRLGQGFCLRPGHDGAEPPDQVEALGDPEGTDRFMGRRDAARAGERNEHGEPRARGRAAELGLEVVGEVVAIAVRELRGRMRWRGRGRWAEGRHHDRRDGQDAERRSPTELLH